MLKFKTSCAVLAYLSSNLLNEVGLSLFRYFEVGLRVCDNVVKKFMFAISSPDEFLYYYAMGKKNRLRMLIQCDVYDVYKWPLVVDTGERLKKSPKFKRTRPKKTIL